MQANGNKVLAGEVSGGRVILSCRRGAADDLTIYACREGESEFTPLDDEGECVIDSRPKLNPEQPEVRRYFAVLLYSGEENRLKSNEITVTVP